MSLVSDRLFTRGPLDVDLDILLDIVAKDLPPLIGQLEGLLSDGQR